MRGIASIAPVVSGAKIVMNAAQFEKSCGKVVPLKAALRLAVR